MMFATGIGIGLMFWGVAEPLTHFAYRKQRGNLISAALYPR